MYRTYKKCPVTINWLGIYYNTVQDSSYTKKHHVSMLLIPSFIVFHQMIICDSRFLPVTRGITPYCQNQMMQLIQCNKRIRKPLKNKQTNNIRVTNNRNLIIHTFNLSSLTVMVKIHAVSSKLWQELSQSMNETLPFMNIRKESGKIYYEKTAAIS